MNDQSEYLSPREAARRCGVTVATLRNWERRGQITAYRLQDQGWRRYRADELPQPKPSVVK